MPRQGLLHQLTHNRPRRLVAVPVAGSMPRVHAPAPDQLRERQPMAANMVENTIAAEAKFSDSNKFLVGRSTVDTGRAALS